MYHLKLCKGLSYSGVVSATSKKPDVFTDDEAVYKAALASGYFEEVGAGTKAAGKAIVKAKPEVLKEDEKSEDDRPSEHATELSKMTVTELKQYASIKGISLEENLKKGAIVKAIMAAEEKADRIRESFRNGE